MPNAIRIHELGGPEVLRWEPVAVGDPGPGEVRLRHTAVGLNFIDVYHRTGLYPVGALPFTPGMEGAGVVEALGEGVTRLAVGDRVAYASNPIGAYAEVRLMPADRLVKLPGSIDDTTAAAMMLQGMTAQYLLRQTYRVVPGQTILFHAVAGGVGLIACQWAKYLGATVIGTVGSPEKGELARAHGCDYIINYREENVAERVREITHGHGVPVVYDSVGRDTFMKSLDCLSPRGMLVSFGQSSGPMEPFNVGLLGAKGCLYLTRPSLFVYTASSEELQLTAEELMEMVVNKRVKIEVNQTFPLSEAAEAHRALEGRRTTGSTVLTV